VVTSCGSPRVVYRPRRLASPACGAEQTPRIAFAVGSDSPLFDPESGFWLGGVGRGPDDVCPCSGSPFASPRPSALPPPSPSPGTCAFPPQLLLSPPLASRCCPAAVRPLSGRCPAALSDQSISRGAFRCHGVRQGSSLACPPTHSPPYPHEPVRARHILALTASLGTRRTGAATPSTAAWSHPALLSTPRGASFAAVRYVPNAAQKNLAAAQQVDLEF